MTRARAWRLATPALAVVAGLAVMTLGLWLAGYDAGAGLAAMARGAAGSWYAFTSATLVRAAPLLLIGLGFAFAARGGALNIGGEGQFYAGAIAATIVGTHAHALPAALALPLPLAAGLAAGALSVAVPVVLRVRYGVFEVISTLLLNFVAEAVVSWVVQGPLQEPSRIYPQSAPIAAAARLPLLPGTRLHLGLALGLVAAAALWYVAHRTYWGFALRAAGEGPEAARVSGGVRVGRLGAVALLWSGALAGVAGATEVAGVSYALYPNLSPGYGFTAIAVALLARLEPAGVVVTAVLFGALEAGAQAMQRDAAIPSVVVYIAEAVVIVTVLVVAELERRGQGAVAVPDDPGLAGAHG